MEHWLQVSQYENMIIFNSIFSRSVGHVPKFSQRMQRYYLSCNDKVFAKVAIQEWIFLSNCIRAIINIHYSSKSFIRRKHNKICSNVKSSIF